MKSPFPGMDPFLEGYLWSDVHNGLAFCIKEAIIPHLGTKYVARTELYTVTDTHPEEDIGILYPDVEVSKRTDIINEPPSPPYGNVVAISPPTITISAIRPIEIRIPIIEIRERGNNKLITVIKVLSPVNKRKPGLATYRKKREKLHFAGIHLLEIDFLRRGERPFNHPFLPKTHYIVSLLRAGIEETNIWGFNIQDSLPIVPVPLASPDKDVKLDLGFVLDTLYQRSSYHLSIDYHQTVPKPSLSEEDQAWVQQLIQK